MSSHCDGLAKVLVWIQEHVCEYGESGRIGRVGRVSFPFSSQLRIGGSGKVSRLRQIAAPQAFSLFAFLPVDFLSQFEPIVDTFDQKLTRIVLLLR